MFDSEFTELAINYAARLPAEALGGNVFAVSILLILSYILIFLINTLTDIIIRFLKKVILLVIVSLAFYQFLELFLEKLSSEGPTIDTLIFGGVGSVAGFIAFIIAVRAAFFSLRKIHLRGKVPGKIVTAAKEDTKRKIKKHDIKEITSIQALKEDKRLGVVVAYLIVAEFGVISSKTIAAPNTTVGMAFFATFMLAAFFFIYQSYSDYLKGLRHLMVVFVVGGILSIILGYFWGGYPLEELLSEAYFVSDSMVAFVTGIAVSLFMGSKG